LDAIGALGYLRQRRSIITLFGNFTVAQYCTWFDSNIEITLTRIFTASAQTQTSPV